MKVFIIGAGFTGIELARMLSLEGRTVVLIDSDAERVRQASDQLDCTVLAANGNDLAVLEHAGIGSADALVTLTEDDETNMITCSLVDAVYPDLVKIARVRNFAYYETVELTRRLRRKEAPLARPLYGIDHMLNPEVEAAAAIGRAMDYGAVGNVFDLGDNWMITGLYVGAGSPLVGKSLAEVAQLENWRFLVAFVESESGPCIAQGSLVLHEGDRIGVVSRPSDLEALISFTCSTREAFRRIIIFGADRVASLLVTRLTDGKRHSFWSSVFSAEKRHELVVVDQNADRCREIAERHPEVRVLCGDFMDEAFVEEEHLHTADLLVAATGNYDRNLIQAAYMKSLGVGKCIALTERAAYGGVARKLGIDVAVPLRRALVDGIIGHLRGRNVSAIHSVCNRRLEIVEGVISESCAVVGKRLMDLPALKISALVLLASSEEGLRVPKAATVLNAGMGVVVLVPSGDAKILRAFFGKV